ncbi:MAG: RdgB/HAM1 family non-canonical purine NTP pyrophosphatase [Alphaproteobacteria bacterium]|jgi:XTP/dITP diphosphohydrolase|nr:RdgB/HAM1 family non-canonical purine NTP pyrophosphatase [Alphaproteobacteria bacterium]MDP6517487.1 RdgB/HAM1 family non-canonical purine NTP pyrophosphatase [Alphaproteobacteria bacterium]
MARPLVEPRLVVASHNPGKVAEIADLLAGHAIAVVAAGDLDLAEPDETETSFAANALLKARAAAEAANLPALADDSGLVVPALDGAPGIRSARWAGPERDFGRAMAELERRLQAACPDGVLAPAHFTCVLALAWPDGHGETFTGTVHGRLTFPPRGDRGFGYDPVFIPDGHGITFGEMDPARKHAISHRALAFAELTAACLPAHGDRARA